MKNEDIWKLMKEIGDKEKAFIIKNGFARAGTNGFYHQKETPIRNSGHYLVMYSLLYKKFQEKEYRNLVKILADYLQKPEHYGKKGGICHRKEYRFDQTNGLIGQAWTIEALVEAYKCLGVESYLKTAEELFFYQPFLKEKGFWQVRDLDGSLGFDFVYNHQLWFAAAGTMICQVSSNADVKNEIEERIKRFLCVSEETLFSTDEEGVIQHHMQYNRTKEEEAFEKNWQSKHKWKAMLHQPWKVCLRKYRSSMEKFPFTDGLELGYQLFDLYGFALLYEKYSDMALFQSESFKRSISFVADRSCVRKVLSPCGGDIYNKFSAGYNHPAFEYAFVAKTFGCYEEKIDHLFWNHLEQMLNNETFAFSKEKGFDLRTFRARLYEAGRGLE